MRVGPHFEDALYRWREVLHKEIKGFAALEARGFKAKALSPKSVETHLAALAKAGTIVTSLQGRGCGGCHAAGERAVLFLCVAPGSGGER